VLLHEGHTTQCKRIIWVYEALEVRELQTTIWGYTWAQVTLQANEIPRSETIHFRQSLKIVAQLRRL
jgi:hypothetical protein